MQRPPVIHLKHACFLWSLPKPERLTCPNQALDPIFRSKGQVKARGSYLGVDIGVFRDVSVLIWINFTPSVRQVRPTTEGLSACSSSFRRLSRLQSDALQTALKPGDDPVVGEDRCLEQALGFLDESFEEATPQAM